MSTSTAPTSDLAPVIKQVVVPCTPERAFELFTGRIGDWWPLATHSVGEAHTTGVTVDGRVGGLVVETSDDGSTAVWGTVTVWEPPLRLCLTWHPGQEAEHATDVEVTFTDDGVRTRVTLVHSGWERRSDGASVRQRYLTGWDPVIARYVACV